MPYKAMLKEFMEELYNKAAFALLYFAFPIACFYTGSAGSFSPYNIASMFFLLGIPLGVVCICNACPIAKRETLNVLILLNAALMILVPLLGSTQWFWIFLAFMAATIFGAKKRQECESIPFKRLAALSAAFAAYLLLANSPTIIDKIECGMNPPKQIPAPQSFSAAEYNKAAFKIFRQAEEENPDDNILFSNLSAMQIMAMYYLGMDEAGREKFSSAFPAFKDADTVAQAMKYVTEMYSSNRGATTGSVALAADGLDINPEYGAMAKEIFGEGVKSLRQFDGRGASAWLERVTRGRIKQAGFEIPPDTMAAFINASTFVGEWAVKFDKSQTRNDTFRSPGGEIQTPFMYHDFSEAKYCFSENFASVQLEYSKRSDIAFTVIIPDPWTEAGKKFFLKDINYGEYIKAAANAKAGNIEVYLPKFHFKKSKFPMLKALRRAGADMTAGLPKMSPKLSGGIIGRMESVTEIEVNEDGTKVFTLSHATASIGVDPVFKADKPFKFFIVDKTNSLILFMGTVNDPSKN